MTRWAKDVSPERVHPEYPRPQMVRPDWTNLNGLWDYAIRPRDEDRPDDFDGQILVPFPVESALSGVMKPVGEPNRLWYRRTFEVPRRLAEAVACCCTSARWTGRRPCGSTATKVGEHRGGYDPFTLRHHRRAVGEAGRRNSSSPSGTRPTRDRSPAASR